MTLQPPGLKDHEIQGMVTALKNKLRPMIPHQCLREVISASVMQYLRVNNLRIDEPKAWYETGIRKCKAKPIPTINNRKLLIEYTKDLMQTYAIEQYWDGEPCSKLKDPTEAVDKFLRRYNDHNTDTNMTR